MINKELTDYIRNSLLQGKSKEEIEALLRQQGGWTEEDLKEAFDTNQIIKNNIPIKITEKNKSFKWLFVSLLALGIVVCGIYFLFNRGEVNSETGQVMMKNDHVAGSNREFVLKKGDIVNVSKEYFLPQILLPGPIGGMHRFDTPPPMYTQIGTGVYFSGKEVTEVTPFKGKMRPGAIGEALSMGYSYNRFIVYGFFIFLIVLVILIINKFKKRKDSSFPDEKGNNYKHEASSKKISFFFPIALGILLITSVFPFSFIKIYLSLPVQSIAMPILEKYDMTSPANWKKTVELFPVSNSSSQAEIGRHLQERDAYWKSITPWWYVPLNILVHFSGEIIIILFLALIYFFRRYKRRIKR